MSGVSAPFGSLFYDRLADKVGRRASLMAFTPIIGTLCTLAVVLLFIAGIASIVTGMGRPVATPQPAVTS